MRDPKMILVIEEERQAAVLENDRLRAELADAKAIARYETDCVEAAKEHITKLDAELAAKDARIAETERCRDNAENALEAANARIAELDRDIAAKAHNLTYLNARAERAEAKLAAVDKQREDFFWDKQRAEAELKAMREAFRNADDSDWEWLFALLGYHGHGKFWKAVFTEFRAALNPSPTDKEPS